MSNIHVKLISGYKDGTTKWEEEYDLPDNTDFETHFEAMIQRFNDTLRPGEKERVYLGYIIPEDSDSQTHEWVKTNLVTLNSKGLYYDTVKCTNCGMTGRRYGLTSVILDSKYRKAIVYMRCDTAKKHLQNKKEN